MLDCKLQTENLTFQIFYCHPFLLTAHY